MSWDPGQYLRFADLRLRPALDLLARVELEGAATVVDLGCGPGNVTRLLARKFPHAEVIGIDSSATMLAKAAETPSTIAWRQADIGAFAPQRPVDILYSNAALHWLDGHAGLFPRLMQAVRPGGILAVQMPRNHAAPSHAEMNAIAESGPWATKLKPVLRPSPVAPPEAYYDLLAPESARLDIWETVYGQILEGDDPVVAWNKSTGLRPILEALDEAERGQFLAEYGARMAAAYPKRADGRTFFPFRRLFLVAVRK
jgi:trans-aconitate 2-methyltransferase